MLSLGTSPSCICLAAASKLQMEILHRHSAPVHRHFDVYHIAAIIGAVPSTESFLLSNSTELTVPKSGKLLTYPLLNGSLDNLKPSSDCLIAATKLQSAAPISCSQVL